MVLVVQTPSRLPCPLSPRSDRLHPRKRPACTPPAPTFAHSTRSPWCALPLLFPSHQCPLRPSGGIPCLRTFLEALAGPSILGPLWPPPRLKSVFIPFSTTSSLPPSTKAVAPTWRPGCSQRPAATARHTSLVCHSRHESGPCPGASL
jgi:hypothetical protein